MIHTLKKVSVASVAAIMTFSLAFSGLMATASAEMSVAQMMELIAQLQAQLSTLDEGFTATTATTAGEYMYRTNKTIDYEFTNVLRIGSRGEEVTMLQKALGMDLESKGIAYGYFGWMTGDAVKAFQVSAGYTGTPVAIVGPFTLGKLNEKATVITTTTPTGTTVSGDVLVVEGEAADDMRIGNTQKVIFTKLTLTAGDEDVIVKDIIVEVSGGASETNDFEIDRVILLDDAKVQLDYDSSLNSSNEAKLDVDVTIRDGESMDFYIAAQTDADVSTSDNLEVTLEVTDIVTDGADVEGLSVAGATMLLNHNLSLDSYKTSIADEATEAAVGNNDVVFAVITVENPSAGNDDFIMKSVKVEETGTIDEEDSLDNVSITFDGKTYEGSYDNHEYSFDFGDGIDIEDGEQVELNLQGDVIDGSAKSIVWKVKDSFVENEDGSILADTTPLGTNGGFTTDSYGSVVNKTTDVSNGNIAAGDTDAELASFKYEAQGGEDMTGKLNIKFTISGTVPADYSDVILTNVAIYTADGDLVSSTEEVEWAAAGSVNVEFSDVQFESDNDALDYVIKADVNENATNGAIYTVTQLGDGTKTYFDIEVESNESISDVTAVTTIGTVKTVKGAALTIAILGTLDDQTVKTDSSNVELAVVQLDTVASGKDITVKKLSFDFVVTDNGANTPTIADLDECVLYDGDDVVTSQVNVDAAKETFTLDDGGYEVEAGVIKTLSLQCTITDTFVATDAIDVDLTDAGTDSTTSTDSEYSFKDGTTTVDATISANTSAQIVISAASVAATDDEEATATTVKTGDTVELGTVKLDPTDVTGTVLELPLKVNAFTNLASNRLVEVWANGTQVANAYLSSTTAIVDTWLSPLTLTDGVVTELTFKAKIADAVSAEGAAVAVNVNAGTLKMSNGDNYTVIATTLTGVKVYSGLAKIEKEVVSVTAGANKEVLVYKVTAEGEDIVMTNLAISAAAGTVANGEFGYSSKSATADLTATAMYYSSSRTGTMTAFAAPVTITAGTTKYFVVRGSVTIDSGEYIAVEADLTGMVKVNTVAISPVEADLLSLDDYDSTDEAVLQNLAK